MSMLWPEPHRKATGVWRSPIAWLIPPLAVLIGGIGVATLYSVAGGSMDPWAMRHVMRLIVGFAMLFGLALVPSALWMRLAYPIYIIALLLVAAVLVRGTQALGAQRWLVLGPISLQPSELMKFALILVLARYFHQLPARNISKPMAVLIPLAMVAVPMLLILKQPDLGTAVLLGVTGLTLIFLAGAPLQYFALGGGLVAAIAPVFWVYLHGYQKQRLLVFWDPAIDPLGKGYQIYQSKIALGSGGLAGKGFLQGTQTQLDFVPEKHTDFVFALWAETWPGSSRDPPPALPQRAIALGWIVVILGVSAVATRDYFSWNRARWNAIRSAERLGATAETLDGGFEYNGLRRFEQQPRVQVPGKSWWWVRDDRYVVAFSSLPGYDEIETWRVEHWLSRSPSEVKLLRRR